MKNKHLEFEQISEQYDLVKSGDGLNNTHLSDCEKCSGELKNIAHSIDLLKSFDRCIVLRDPERFTSITMRMCTRKNILDFKNVTDHKYFKHGAAAAVAAVFLMIAVPALMPDKSPQLADNSQNSTNAHSDTEISITADSVEELVYFLKKNNIRVQSVNKDSVTLRAKYRTFLQLKNAADVAPDRNLNILWRNGLSLAGTASGGNMYVPGGDRIIEFKLKVKNSDK